MREGYELLEVYLEGHAEDIKEQRPFLLRVTDLSDFTMRIVKAKVSQSAEALPKGKDLWLKTTDKDRLKPDPWKMEVLEEYDEDEVTVERPDLGRIAELDSDRIY